jgi:hypothetical protein
MVSFTFLGCAAGAADDISGFGLLHQELLKLLVLVVRQALLNEPSKELGFDEAEHQAIVRQGRIGSRRKRRTKKERGRD